MAEACSAESSKVQHIVADSAAFLKNAPLHQIGENVYTVEDVINEIRDAATRQRLAVLPYDIQLKQPSSDAIHAVSEFAKLTGDFRSLSAVDICVLALTYQLEKEHCGTEHIKVKPTQQIEITRELSGKKIPGFFVQKRQEDINIDKNDSSEEKDEDSQEGGSSTEQHHNQSQGLTASAEDSAEISDLSGCSKCETKDISEGDLGNSSSLTVADIETGVENIRLNPPVQQNNEKETRDEDEGFDEHSDEDFDNDDDGDDDDDDDDDDAGWITPDNLSQVREQMGKGALDPVPAEVTVGCLTTDFAMQNVLIQMGLHVISVDGMLIKEARSYVLKCYGCFRVTSQSGKMFCPWCGNSTLQKLPVSVDDKGVTHYHVSNRKKTFNIRGKKHPIPLPKGGRHSEVAVLTEDQPRGQHRLPRNKDHADVWDPNYLARTSPFAANDVTSRASQLGYHLKRGSENRKNPNEVKKKSGRRKK